MVRNAPRRRARRTVWLLVSFVVVVAAAEALVAVLLGSPRTSLRWPPALHALYQQRFALDPFDARLTEPDADRGHRLRPGRRVITTPELATALDINSQGLRDDEPSLHAPEIVILGDSQAFGWGVEASKTFAQLLEEASGRRVLNAGVPGYGTALQRRLLSRVDASRLRVVVVQYGADAFAENAAFHRGRNELRRPDEAAVRRRAEEARQRRRYMPGRHLWDLAKSWRHRVTPSLVPVRADEEARLFLNALSLAGAEFDRPGVRLIVVQLERGGAPGRGFIDQVRQQAHSLPGLPSWIAAAEAVDLSAALSAADHYDLDRHLRPSGHAAVAAKLVEVLGAEGGTARYAVESAGAGHEALMAGGDDAWAPARAISWGPPEYATTFRALWNEEGLFVLFDAIDPRPWHTLRRKDMPIFKEEVVEIFLDLDRSGTHYAEVEINPVNVVYDSHILHPLPMTPGDPPWQGDHRWNLQGLESRTWMVRDAGRTTGWRAVAFLPWLGFKSLPSAAKVALPPRRGDVWRFNVFRIERPHGPEEPERDAVYAAWSPASIPKFHVASVFRDLELR